MNRQTDAATDAAVGRAVGGATQVAGIIGDPVAHSRSPAIWNAAFDATGLDWVFVAFRVGPGQAGAALDGMRALGIAGLNVTMPHKSDAATACDELTPTAEALQAVNAVARTSRAASSAIPPTEKASCALCATRASKRQAVAC